MRVELGTLSQSTLEEVGKVKCEGSAHCLSLSAHCLSLRDGSSGDASASDRNVRQCAL